ncbi:MAG: family 16 glycosylhydrolase [Pseudomonadota bacterium]
MENFIKTLSFLLVALCPHLCLATGSAELYTSASYGYGRFEARARFAAGDGVVSSFFLWKVGSEQPGMFWNELDFEKLGADCHLETNAIYGSPSTGHSKQPTIKADFCGAYHTFAYEWTPDAIVWLVDGVEIRRETGAVPLAFAQNASSGMRLHFNVWPGDASFGGNFSPSILPVHEYIDWVQFSAYKNGAFTVTWRQDFAAATAPDAWLTGSWASPKNISTDSPKNVNFIQGYAVLSLTADNALGPAGAMPGAGAGASGGSAGASSGSAGASSGGASGGSGRNSGGSSGGLGSAGTVGSAGAAGSPAAGGGLTVGGAPGTGGAAAVGGAPGALGSAGTQALAGAGGALNSGGPANTAGAPDGSTAGTKGSSCSFGRSLVGSDVSWALCLLMSTFLHRRGRRRRSASSNPKAGRVRSPECA